MAYPLSRRANGTGRPRAAFSWASKLSDRRPRLAAVHPAPLDGFKLDRIVRSRRPDNFPVVPLVRPRIASGPLDTRFLDCRRATQQPCACASPCFGDEQSHDASECCARGVTADLPAALAVDAVVVALDVLPVVVCPPADSAIKVRQAPTAAEQTIRVFMMTSKKLGTVQTTSLQHKFAATAIGCRW